MHEISTKTQPCQVEKKRRKLTGPIKIKIFGIINQHKSKTAYVFISAIEQ